MVKYADFCKEFCEIEKRYSLFKVDTNNIRYWKYARYFVYNVLVEKLYGICVPAWYDLECQTVIDKYKYGYQRITDTFFHNVNIGLKKDILMFTFPRRVKEKKQFISPVTDEIALNLKRSACIVETPYYGGYYRPVPIRGIKYYNVWDDVGNEKEGYIPISRGKLRKQILSVFEKEFDIQFTTEEKRIILININHYIMYRDELLMSYKKIISKVNPKVVLYTMSYIGEWVVLTETLKEMGIPGVEILHGYVDDNCIAYNYTEVGLNDALPDYIFAYSQVQKETLNWGIPKDHIRVVGNPWLERKKKEFIFERKERKKKTITFISSTHPAIEKYLVKLEDCIDKDQYEIIFKLHPEEYVSWRKFYPNISEHIKVIDNNEKDIHFYLANSDVVVGITSTALFEAAVYPVDIYILGEDSWQNMGMLLRAGRATLIHDSNELFSCIMDGAENKSDMNSFFYEENAIENINTEIEEIIREGEGGD